MCTTFICCKILAFIARALTAHVLIYCVECMTALRVRCFVSCLYNPLSTENEAVGTESFMYRTHNFDFGWIFSEASLGLIFRLKQHSESQ